MLTRDAPAKLNLTLEVLSRKPNGFHEIRSVIQTIDLRDTLRFSRGPKITVRGDRPDWVPGQSLVSRTADLLRDETGCRRGVTIEVTKRIPLLSGLGGDSSGAAATLLGLNDFWELGLSPPELAGYARRLGSDVTFFLEGGTALVQGEGEQVAPLPPLPQYWAVLVVPELPRDLGKTGRLYGSLEANHFTEGEVTEELLVMLTGGNFAGSSLPLFNVFEEVTDRVFPGLAGYRERLLAAGAGSVHLAGSGPSLFTLLAEKEPAEAVYRRLCEDGLEAYLAVTL
jgi:4-diphosphocytidyl-2-C-methyl-D-erythritol kinase